MTKLETLRLSKRLTVNELVDKSGVSRFTIRAIERGETVARDDTLFKLADALEVEPTDLIDPKPEPVAEAS